jgi:hypothetical protein
MNKKMLILVAAVGCAAITPAFAQHPHGAAGNAGGSHGPAMNNGADHDSGSTSSKAATSSSPTSLLTTNTKLDTNLTAKLQSKGLLPAGTDLKDACDGYKNLGQCVAAIHVSHNLDIPFACMKANMTGTTPLPVRRVQQVPAPARTR